MEKRTTDKRHTTKQSIKSVAIQYKLDQELTRRGLRFVRYAGAMQVFVSSMENEERVMRSVTKFIEERMRLKVNSHKSKVQKCYESIFQVTAIFCVFVLYFN